jgi:hypothetical protein
MPKANIRAPTNLQEAAELLAVARHSRTDKWGKGRVFRVALEEYLAEQDDLPEEARDLLDEDLETEAGESLEEVADA